MRFVRRRKARTAPRRVEPLEARRLLAAPTAIEQYMLELVNRARANPAAEGASFGIDLNEGLAPGTISSDPKQPLAFNPYLIDSARGHSQWMLDNQTISHDENGVDPTTRMANAGYVFNPPAGSAENIAFRGSLSAPPLTQTIAQEHQDLFVDSSEASRGHRLNLLDPNMQEVGIGVATGLFEGYNAVLATQDFAYSAGNGPILSGVAYSDALIHDHFYEPGEGLGGVLVTATSVTTGATYSASTWDSGGYSLPLPPDTYAVTASSTSLGGTITDQNVTIGAQNVKLDFVPSGGPFVAGRYVFYNNSVFDGGSAGAGPADDAAIAPDKQPLLAGNGPATFANYTSYSKGINGIMVDLANLPPGASLGQADFSFSAGNSNDPSSWQSIAAPTPLVRPGAGVGGSTRVEFVFPDGLVRNEWLQATVQADANTGLATPDVFYFGNLVGGSGSNPAAAAVTFTDQVAARSDPHGLRNPASITNPHDYNRDGKVDAADQLIARYSFGKSLLLISPPPVGATPAASAALVPTFDSSLPLQPRKRLHREARESVRLVI